MNETVNKYLLEGEKVMPEMHLKQPALSIMLVVHSKKTKKELKSLCRLEIQILFRKMGLIRLVCNMIWPLVNQKT